MSEVRISAESRTDFGKGGARRTRRAGKIPAVLYGHGEKPKHIALPNREFAAALRNGGMNQLFRIEVADGTKALALAKALQRDPIKDTIDHVDLLLVRRGEKVTVEVPVQLTGDIAKDGGLLVTELNSLSVVADATSIPDHFEVSIAGLATGSNITAGQVSLPAGVELATDPDAVVASSMASPSAAQVEAELAQAEAAAGIEKPAAADAEATPAPEPVEA